MFKFFYDYYIYSHQTNIAAQLLSEFINAIMRSVESTNPLEKEWHKIWAANENFIVADIKPVINDLNGMIKNDLYNGLVKLKGTYNSCLL